MNAGVALRRIARLIYGDALASMNRRDGIYPVIGSGGRSGSHDLANASGPAIIVGRKGSYGSVHWEPSDCFIIDTAYVVHPYHAATEMRWLYYALQSVDLRGASQDVGVPGLSREAAYAVELAYASPGEQRRIAAFLDDQMVRLDELVCARTKQLNALSDHLAAVRESVLVGASDDVQVPLMHLTNPYRPIVYGIVQAGPDDPTGIPYIKTGDLPELDPDRLSRTSAEIHSQYGRSVVRPGDIVMAMRASIGTVAMVPETLLEANLTQGTARLAAAADVDSMWLLEAVSTRTVREQCKARAVGTTFATLNIWDLRRIRVPYLPFGRQREVAAELGRVRAQYLALASQVSRALSVLAERRQALITAAVTGQIDVTTARGVDV